MKGLRPIRTVSDLMQYLWACNPDSQVLLMPEQGDSEGFPIGGVLEFSANRPPQVWILLDENAEIGAEGAMEWSGGPSDDEDIPFDVMVAQAAAGGERPGDMATALTVVEEKEKIDIVKIRGKMRQA